MLLVRGGFKTNVVQPPTLELNTTNTSSIKSAVHASGRKVSSGSSKDGDIISVTGIQELEPKKSSCREIRFPVLMQ